MKTFLLFMLSVFSAAIVFSQPQAPIEWGEARWAHLAGWPGLPQITTLRVIPMGDTLLFTALNVFSEVSDTILVCSSFDNGQTFTPWIPISDGSENVSANFSGSAGQLYCFFNRGWPLPSSFWIRISGDGGLTWGPQIQYRTDAYYLSGFASGNEVIGKYMDLTNNDLSTRIIHSFNSGQSWSGPIIVDTTEFNLTYFYQSIAFTKTHRLLIEEPAPSRYDYRLYAALGDSTGQNWTPFQVLPCQYYNQWACQYAATIIGDTTSEAAGVLGKFGLGDFSFDRPFHWRTTNPDSGWEDCVALTEEAHVIPWWATDVPLNIGQGKLWLVGWENDDAQGWYFFGTRFSANHGKNWYPLQMAADSLGMTLVTSGQIRGNQIDLYWMQACWEQTDYSDYRMVTGTITPDTTYPVIAQVTAPPETVQVGQSYPFSVSVTDNDTLSDVRLLIVGLSGDTLRNTMAQNGNQLYHFSWEVPDSGYYVYWYEAEDWWENVAFLPDSGTYHFMTEGWTSVSDVILHPSAFSVSVSPNPFNAITEITFTLPKTQPVSLRIYDVLGREVSVLVDEVKIAGEHHVTFNAAGFSSGTYWCRMEAGGFVKTQRIVLLK